MSGSVVAQGLGLAASPIISRLFTPAEFGVFGSFSAVTTVVGAAVTLDYDQAIMLPKERSDARVCLLLSCLVTAAMTMVCAVVCLLWPRLVLSALNAQSVWLLLMLGLTSLVGGLNTSFQAWCVRTKAFDETAKSQVVRGIATNGLQVSLGMVQWGAFGLIVSWLAAELLATVNLVHASWKDLVDAFREATWTKLRRAAAEYMDFPIFSASQSVLNALSAGLPVLLLTHFFGIETAGAYAFAMRLLNAPMKLILGALRQVLLQRASEMQHDGERLTPLFLKSTIGLFGLGVLPTLGLSLGAPYMFTLAFGDSWRVSGEFARYLVFWLLFAFCNVPAVLLARLIRVQQAMFMYNALLLTVRALALVLGGLYMSAMNSILLYSAIGAVMNVLLILYVGRQLATRDTLAPA